MVSVIVPIYNVEKYLHRCIDCILAQTFTDFELILVDDGSPDNCGTICDEYANKDSRVHVIHQKNSGVSAARNTGLKTAKGKYISFCDSDDYWDADYLMSLVQAITSSNADWVVANMTAEDENGAVIYQTNHYPGIDEVSSLSSKWDYFINGVWGSKHGWEVYTRIFNAEIIRSNRIRFCTTCGNYAEDLGFVLEFLLYARKLCSIVHSGYHYVVHDGSMMRRSKQVVKLNQMNELSIYFARSYDQVFCSPADRRAYSILHFMLMSPEYTKLVGTPKYCTMADEVKKIQNQPWFFKQTKGIFRSRKRLEHYFGKRVSKQILLLSNYCLHGNWKRFCIESTIAYRWLIKKE